MNLNNVTKHYDKLTINERFALMNAANYRGDHADRDALARTAPRKVWNIANTTGLFDAFDMAASWHIMHMLLNQANYYFLLSVVDDDLIRAVDVTNIIDRAPVDISETMQQLLTDTVTTCAAWRVVCGEYGVDPVKVLEGMPGALALGIFEVIARRMIEETTGATIDPDELATSAADMRAVIEQCRKRWE